VLGLFSFLRKITRRCSPPSPFFKFFSLLGGNVLVPFLFLVGEEKLFSFRRSLDGSSVQGGECGDPLWRFLLALSPSLLFGPDHVLVSFSLLPDGKSFPSPCSSCPFFFPRGFPCPEGPPFPLGKGPPPFSPF